MSETSMEGSDFFDDLIREIEEDGKNHQTLLLMLPDGATQGRWEAVRAWHEIFAEVRRRYPNRQFQFLPHTYAATGHTYDEIGRSALESILAVSI